MAIGTIAGLKSDDFKLNTSLSLVELNKGETTTITVTSPSDGPIYAISSNTNIVTVSVNNKSITINYIEYGAAIITVGQNYGTGNYASITPPTINIFVTIKANSILGNNSWQIISEVAQSGLGPQYWSIGDVKPIALYGQIGTVEFNDLFWVRVFILHFNHPYFELLPGFIQDNNIIFGGFKSYDGQATSVGADIALVDSNYNNVSNDGTLYFNMYHWGSARHYDGWRGTDLRYDILGATSTAPSGYGSIINSTRRGYDAIEDTLINPKSNTLLAALPNDLRAVLKLWSRWVQTSSVYSSTTTIDAISLLTSYEVLGTTFSNAVNDIKRTTRMDYYNLDNAFIRYKHNDITSSINWWLANAVTLGSNKTQFCVVTSNVIESNPYPDAKVANYSLAIAPAFKV